MNHLSHLRPSISKQDRAARADDEVFKKIDELAREYSAVRTLVTIR